MKLSRYNYIYQSTQYGYFLYNTRTNVFLQLDEETYQLLAKCRDGRIQVEETAFPKEMFELFVKQKIFVTDVEDDNYILQKKYRKYLQKFDNKTLSLVIVPTFTCNFACPYCYEHDLPDVTMNEYTENEIIQFIQSFKNVHQIQLCWHGGEPLLGFQSMKRLLMKMRQEKINLTSHNMVSNGYLFDEEKCQFFAEYDLSSVQITIDGIAETHDRSRMHKSGKPTYEVIMRNVDMIFRMIPKCHVTLRMNIHEKNKHEVPALYWELKQKWADKNMSIHFCYTVDHGDCKIPCIKDKNTVFFAKEMVEKYNIQGIEFYPRHKLGGCTADFNTSFVVGPQGELYKCWVDIGNPTKVIGHINSSDLNLPLFSEYVMGTDMFNDDKCLKCFLLPVCDGGCPLFRLNHKLKGTVYDVCPIHFEELPLLLDTVYEQQCRNSHIDS